MNRQAQDSFEASRRIESILLNLLDTSRLETNELPLRLQSTDVNGLAKTAVNLARTVARGNEATIRLASSDALVMTEIDPDVVLRIFENLIDNALQHAHSATVSVTQREATTLIEVSDDGPSVPPDVRKHIFEKFSQAQNPRSPRAHRGPGLTFVQNAALATPASLNAVARR